MPTTAEFEELLNDCARTPEIINGKYGWRLTSTKNGNSIFLPAAGYRSGGRLINDGYDGSYWSSSLVTDGPSRAWDLLFGTGNYGMATRFRYYGQSVRPVTE